MYGALADIIVCRIGHMSRGNGESGELGLG